MSEKLLIGKKRKSETAPGVNGYYLAVSKRLGFAKWISFLLAVLLIVFTVIFNRDEITLNNFRYLLKHFDVNSANDVSNFTTLKYDNSGNYSFGYYKDDLVVVSSTGVNFYDMHGNSVLSKAHSMSNPQVKSTENYLYVYDLGNYTYSVYNSFSCLYSKTLEYPVNLISAGNSGVFAVVTKNLEYRSTVEIYDKNFKLLSQVSKDKLIMDVSVSDDGKSVMIVSCETDTDGSLFTELQLVRPGSADAVYTVNINDCFPVKCGVMSGGNACVLCSDRYLTLDGDGNIKNQYNFSGDTPTSFDTSSEYSVLTFNKSVIGYDSNMIVFDKNGEKLNEITVAGSVNKVVLENVYAYAMLTDSVCRIGLKDGNTAYEDTDNNPLDFVVRGEEALLICYSDRTESLPYSFLEKE